MARLTPAVVRTLDILELFADGGPPLTAADVVRMTDIPKSTAHELLATLVSRGYLERDDATGTYRLGVRVLHLGNAYTARFDMLSTANEVARDLSARTGETVSVAILEGADVFYLAKVEPRDTLPLPSAIGQRLPANATGLGKALLAYQSPARLEVLFEDPTRLPRLTERSIRTLDALRTELEQVRRVGAAFEHEESTPGVACVAAPVRDVTGQVVAAISLSLAAARFAERSDEEWASLVQGAARRLSERLGFPA